MQADPRPLATEIPADVHLPNTPLALALAQVRFPPILTINKADAVADFQEALRGTYPHLNREEVRDVDLTRDEPAVSKATIWRLADRERPASWRVSLASDFVALETNDYTSRGDFLARFREVVANVAELFRPADAKRVGVRYVDRLTGNAVGRIGELVHPGILGLLQPGETSAAALRDSTVHLLTQAQLLAEEGVIQGRWGNLPPNTTHDPSVLEPVNEPTWVLDLDMFTPSTVPFEADMLAATAERFARRLYSVFRQMVTDEFLTFYGGKP